MKFHALVRDALLEIRASRLMIFYAVFAIGILLVELFVLGRSSSMHMNLNGQEVSATGGVALARLFLPTAAGFLASVLGLFTLFGMSDVMTPVLTRGTAEVYLSKPVPRWLLLLARIAGHWVAMLAAMVGTLAAIFLLAGLRVGVWDARVFLAVAPAMLNILVYLAMLTLSNILTGSSGISGLLSFGVFMLSSVLQFREPVSRLIDNPVWHGSVQALYVILPKPQEIEAGIKALVNGQGDIPWFAMWTSALFAAGCVGLAIAIFRRRDY